MTEAEMKILAAWVRGGTKTKKLKRCDVYEYAEDKGIEININDYVKLFHCINEGEDINARHHD